MDVKEVSCHTLVIGAGSAGIEAYKNAVSNDNDCIIVDTGPLGTTAQRSGELPVSLLMEAGHALHSMSRLKDLGIVMPSKMQADTSNVLSSMRAIRARATAEVLSFMYKIPENKRIRGLAKFLDKNTAQVDNGLIIKFETAIIATGSSPLITYEQSKLNNILTTNEFFELEKLPKSVAIFGSSKIGLELGQALSYLDVEIAVFGQRKLWSLTDDSVLTVAHQLLSSKFNLYVDTYITSMEDEKDGSGYSIYYIDDRSYENYLHMESVIAATDRIANVGNMNLQKLGIKLSRTGCIQIDSQTMQTSVPNIFAAGDVCHDNQLSSVAISEGKYAGINATTFPNLSYKEPQVRVDIVYTDPALAIVGSSLDELRAYASETKDNFIISVVRLKQGHFRGLREDGGIINIYVSVKSHLVLGAEICAYKGDQIAQFLALAMQKKMTVDELSEFAYYHLSAESIIGLAAKDACLKLSKSK